MKMFCRQQKQSQRNAILVNALVILAIFLLPSCMTLSPAPADHLVPPPLPFAQSQPLAPLPQPRQRLKPYSFVSETRAIPLRASATLPDAQPAAAAPTTAVAASSILQQQQQQEQQQPGNGPGFMTRIARWFGFGDAPHEQQLTGSNYAYPKPQQPLNVIAGYDGKAPCNLCNKYPWVPMLPAQAPWQNLEAQASQNVPHKQAFLYAAAVAPPKPQHHHQKQQQQQQLYQPQQQQQQQQLPVKQRAVQFNFPSPPAAAQQQPASPNGVFVPIPVPNLSTAALPPLYNAQPFRPLSTTAPASFTAQELPTTEPAHFIENIGAHSELRPTQLPHTSYINQNNQNSQASNFNNKNNNNNNNNNKDFEIIKSHQLTDFVTSVEYPATYVESHAIDLMPTNHKANTEPSIEAVGTVRYELNGLDTKLPASQLLTELGSFGDGGGGGVIEQQVNTQTPFYEQTTTNLQTNFELELQTQTPPSPFESYYEADNYPSASSQQQQQQQHQQQQQQQQHQQQQQETQQSHFEPWQAALHEFYETTTQTPPPTPPTPTATPIGQLDYTTVRSSAIPTPTTVVTTTTNSVASLAANGFEIVHVPAAVNNHLLPQLLQQQQQVQRQRETPKRLLDAPIKYALGNTIGPSPRPFTRDPAELNYRLGAGSSTPTQHFANHAYIEPQAQSTQSETSSSVFVTPAPATPTSTYGAIDASGHYAGMAPPPPQLQQVVIPYTTMNKPRPFEPTRAANYNGHGGEHKWPHANDIELHEQQESKLVHSATAAPPATNGRRTTKYLTKILASNLRELLKRERETKQQTGVAGATSGFDLNKLQRNIDGWTEQEYTSLSHRPSTPTIRGRSKHIPSEYLTTTPSVTATLPTSRQPKTTGGFNATGDVSELSTSINNLEQILLNDRNKAYNKAKRFQYVPAIDDNSLFDYYESTQQLQQRRRTTALPITTTPTAATTTTTTISTTTTKSPESSTADAEILPFYVRASQAQAAATELWKKAKVAILPQTNEKVYVVTPQPRYFPQRRTTEAPLVDSEAAPSGSKTPRFVVRPTPGNATHIWRALTAAHTITTSTSTPPTTTTSHYTPDIFGLMGLSAYVPADPVEIIDGNSKVINIVTSAPTAMPMTAQKVQEQKHNRSKPTMSPSPR